MKQSRDGREEFGIFGLFESSRNESFLNDQVNCYQIRDYTTLVLHAKKLLSVRRFKSLAIKLRETIKCHAYAVKS
jgi:hypothetical protein